MIDGHFRQIANDSAQRTYTNKHGTISTMNTENIGKRDTGLAAWSVLTRGLTSQL